MSKYTKIRDRPKQCRECGAKEDLYPGRDAGLKPGWWLCAKHFEEAFRRRRLDEQQNFMTRLDREEHWEMVW